MRVTAEWAHRFVALTRMRPKPDVEHAPLPERPDPAYLWPWTWW